MEERQQLGHTLSGNGPGLPLLDKLWAMPVPALAALCVARVLLS